MIKQFLAAMILALALCTGAVAETERVDLNTATVEQLADALHGVGEAKAEAIVAWREENGGFSHIDELVNVRGIGLRTLERNRDRIEVSEASPSS